MSLTLNGTTNIVQSNMGTNVAGTGPAFSAYLIASQTISNATYTKVAFDTKEFDTNSNYDNTTNYRFTPTVAGYYQINAYILGGGSTNTTQVQCRLYKNGTLFKAGGNIVYPSASLTTAAAVSTLVYANGTTDYFEVYGYVNGTGTILFNVGAIAAANSYFQASLVRAA